MCIAMEMREQKHYKNESNGYFPILHNGDSNTEVENKRLLHCNVHTMDQRSPVRSVCIIIFVVCMCFVFELCVSLCMSDKACKIIIDFILSLTQPRCHTAADSIGFSAIVAFLLRWLWLSHFLSCRSDGLQTLSK